MPLPRLNPGPYLDVGEVRRAGRPGDPRWEPPSREERQRRLRQIRGGRSEHDTVSFEEFAELMHPDPGEFSRRIGQVRDQLQQRAADYPAAAPQRRATRDHGQEQTATHQQQRSQGTGPA
ncbi:MULTISPECIES: hypothetical protein [unclassified Streptomyces]|uniref:hypothetical protein n=1 Tax=unclassified Streptomyces TaxID=2593676 RepID=UPI000B0A8CA9|nr:MULTISPECIES: hypothetical protein [unclassified Streptomyces]